MNRTYRVMAALLIALAGCAHTAKQDSEPKPELKPEPKPEPAPDPLEHVLYDGKTGRKVDLAVFVSRAAKADFVAFGELHRHPASSLVQKELLEALAAQDRPIVLAMEFFERDTQGVLDRYLEGEIEEKDFVKWARQAKGYAKSHRPLIEICKEQRWPVVAANAPRRLAKEFRKSDKDYAAFLDSITAAERTYLPRAWSDLEEDERERFFKSMGGHKTPQTTAFTRSMALWDDSMAEACADARVQHPEACVVLLVGAFHVSRGAQTARKFRERRPDDRSLILVVSYGELAFSTTDEGLGDFVLKVHPPEPVKVAKPMPKKHP